MKNLRTARIGYAAALAASLVLAAVLSGTVSYGMAAALAALALAAAFLAWRARRQMLIRHMLENEICTRGELARYAVKLINRGILPLTWTEIKLSSTRGVTGEEEKVTVTLPPFGMVGHTAEFNPPHRGLYILMVESAFISDPFRLNKFSVSRPYPLTLTVMPKLIPISEAWKRRLDPQGRGGIFSQSSDEPAVDSRAYRYGDSQRRIHWNLTARTRELMVRQYESVENRRLMAVLDLSPFKADRPEACEDALIESCLSVVRYALEQRIETTLVYANGEQIRSHTGRDMRIFDEIHRAMCSVGFAASVPLRHLLGGAERVQMLYLFCTQPPGGDVLSALPPDTPVELALVRTRNEGGAAPESFSSVHITELLP
jgi:uncharacterized protein (DUF58 family)